jgi:DHA2 family multidrug resistance protein
VSEPAVNTQVNKWAVAVTVALGALLEVVDVSIVNVAMNDMQNSLGATLSQITWVVSSYAVANVIILPLTAWLGHRFGKKNYWVFSLVGFTIASMLCGMSTSLPMLILARTLQGLTGGGLLAKAQAILFETFPKKEQGMAQAFFGIIVIAGPAIGPTLGGYLVTNVNWRWIFFINLPLGVLAVFMALTFLPKDAPERDRSSIDWLSLALLAAGLGSLQTVLEEGNADDWFESNFIVTFSVIGVSSLVAFVWRQLISSAPVVELRILRYRSLWAGSLLSVVLGMSLYGAIFAIPVFAQSLLHFSSQQVGEMMLPGALASAMAMPMAARAIARFDPKAVFVFGSLLLSGTMVWLSRINPMTGEGDLFIPLILRGFGSVFMFLPLSMATLGPIPKAEVGAATGFYNLTRQLGGSVGVALLATMLARRNAFHHSVLAEHVTVGDPTVADRVSMLPQGKGLYILDAMIRQQASVLSFADMFFITGCVLVGTLPLVLLLGRRTELQNAQRKPA